MNTTEHQNLNPDTHAEHPRMLFFLGSISFWIGLAVGSYGGGIRELFWVISFPLILLWISRVRSLMAIVLIISATICGAYLSSSTYMGRVAATIGLSTYTEQFSEKVSLTGTIDQRLYRGELMQAYRLHIDNIDTISTGSVEVGDLS
jgi:hypothetical protein